MRLNVFSAECHSDPISTQGTTSLYEHLSFLSCIPPTYRHSEDLLIRSTLAESTMESFYSHPNIRSSLQESRFALLLSLTHPLFIFMPPVIRCSRLPVDSSQIGKSASRCRIFTQGRWGIPFWSSLDGIDTFVQWNPAWSVATM